MSLRSATGAEVFDLKEATDIAFGHGTTKQSFPKTTATRFLSNPRDKVDDPKAPTYDLATLLLGYNERNAALGEYLRKANEAGVPFISATDRRIVCSWLAGEGDVDGPEGRIRPLPAGAKREADDAADAGAAPSGAGAPPAKKARYIPDREDQEKVKRMISIIDGPAYGFLVGPNEPKVERSGGAYHNRETVLRGERINVRPSSLSSPSPSLLTRLSVPPAELRVCASTRGAATEADEGRPRKEAAGATRRTCGRQAAKEEAAQPDHHDLALFDGAHHHAQRQATTGRVSVSRKHDWQSRHRI